MNNMIWDAVVWLRKKLKGDKEDIIQAVNNIQNLFETSADATASPSDILEGQTAYNGTVLINGTMKDRRGVTVTTDAVTQDDNYTYLSIPEEACYGVNSKVRTPNSNIASNFSNRCMFCGVNSESHKWEVVWADQGQAFASASLVNVNLSAMTCLVTYANTSVICKVKALKTGIYRFGYVGMPSNGSTTAIELTEKQFTAESYVLDDTFDINGTNPRAFYCEFVR